VTSSGTGQASIISAPLTAVGGQAFTTAEGTALSASLSPPSPGPILVASFSDADSGPQNVNNYTATVDWGDGTTSAGTVANDPAGGFAVVGAHTYAQAGTFPVAVTVRTVADGGVVATVAGTATFAVRVVPLTGGLAPPVTAGSPPPTASRVRPGRASWAPRRRGRR
jgi:hypothetical protein